MMCPKNWPLSTQQNKGQLSSHLASHCWGFVGLTGFLFAYISHTWKLDCEVVNSVEFQISKQHDFFFKQTITDWYKYRYHTVTEYYVNIIPTPHPPQLLEQQDCPTSPLTNYEWSFHEFSLYAVYSQCFNDRVIGIITKKEMKFMCYRLLGSNLLTENETSDGWILNVAVPCGSNYQLFQSIMRLELDRIWGNFL